MQIFGGLGFHKIEGKLDCAEQSGLDQADSHCQAVRSNAQVPDFAGFFGALESFQSAVGAGEGFPIRVLGDLVQLVQVQVFGAQAAQAQFQVFPGPLAVPLHRLRGQNNLLAFTGKGTADLFFAVHIEVCGIVKIDAPFQGPVQHLFGFGKRQTDDRDGPKTDFGYFKSGLSQATITHGGYLKFF